MDRAKAHMSPHAVSPLPPVPNFTARLPVVTGQLAARLQSAARSAATRVVLHGAGAEAACSHPRGARSSAIRRLHERRVRRGARRKYMQRKEA